MARKMRDVEEGRGGGREGAALPECCAKKEEVRHEKKEKLTSSNSVERRSVSMTAVVTLAVVALVLMVFNQVQLLSLQSSMGGKPVARGVAVVSAAVVPKGVPEVYGAELKISYDDVSPADPQRADRAIATLKRFDETLMLEGADLERYINVVSQISCEYCCGADSIIVRREDVERTNKQIADAVSSGKITEEQAKQYQRNAGDMACGCAHSFAMRGLAKYLIQNHGAEFSDAEILEELAKWKVLFFPSQMSAKAEVLKEKGIEFSYANLGSNKYRNIEKGSAAGSGGMVGGC